MFVSLPLNNDGMGTNIHIEDDPTLVLWDREMKAISYKNAAQRLQRSGRYADALPLMLHSVKLRGSSHLLCLSLSELAALYVDMLKFEEAADVLRQMVAESYRYDTKQQQDIAEKILADSKQQQKCGLAYGMSVQLQGLRLAPELNGEVGIIMGRSPSPDRYLIKVNKRTVAARRMNIHLPSDLHVGQFP